MSADNDQNAHLLRKLQNKLRKQRHDLQRAHEYDLKQKLQAQSDRQQSEIQLIHSELSTQADIHEGELQSLKEELQSTHLKEIDEHEKKIANLQDEHKIKYDNLQDEHKIKCDNFQQTNDNLKKQIGKIKNDNKKLKLQSDKVINQKDTVIQNNKHEINNMKEDVKQMQNEIIQWMSNRQSNSIATPSKSDFHEIETKLCELDKNAKDFIDCRLNIWNESNEELNTIVIELDDKEQMIDDLNNQLEDVREELQYKTTELQKIQSNYEDDLIRDINEYKIQTQHLEKLLASEIERKKTVETELTNLIECKENWRSQIMEIEKENNEFDVKNKHQEKIICEMRDKLDKCDNNLQQNQQRIMSLQMELEKTILSKNDMLRQLSDKSDELIEYKTKLAMSNASHRKQISSVEVDLQNALNELRDKTRQCQRLNQRVANIADHANTRVANISDHANTRVKRKRKKGVQRTSHTNVKF